MELVNPSLSLFQAYGRFNRLSLIQAMCAQWVIETSKCLYLGVGLSFKCKAQMYHTYTQGIVWVSKANADGWIGVLVRRPAEGESNVH